MSQIIYPQKMAGQTSGLPIIELLRPFALPSAAISVQRTMISIKSICNLQFGRAIGATIIRGEVSITTSRLPSAVQNGQRIAC